MAVASSILLPDLSLFSEALKRHMAENRSQNRPFAVVVASVRRLRAINVEFGRDAGDKVIAQATARIQSCLHTEDIVARLGSNEFALFLANLHGPAHAELAIHRCITRCRDPLIIDGKRINLKLAFGIACFPEHGREPAALLRAADSALARARERACDYLVHHSDTPPRTSPATIEIELEEAIAENDIEVCYQPKIDLRAGVITGAECLTRWRSPSSGPISPGVFVDIAERTGLITPLTMRTLNAALCHSREWAPTHGAIVPAVNLSPQVLADPEAVELIIQTAEMWGVGDGELALEVTESAMMSNPAENLRTLQLLHEHGIVLAIDDFGTGYSSLAYLQQLPVSELKIDKSFVMNMTEGSDAAKIVKTVIDLAHNLDLKVVAEGVETEAVMRLLTAMGCDYAQGYLFGKPMPAMNLITWLARSPWSTGNRRGGLSAGVGDTEEADANHGGGCGVPR